MSGTIQQLVSDIQRASFTNMHRKHIVALISFILSHQYVHVPGDPRDKVHKVIRGTGMGLSCSCAIADLIICLLMEELFATRQQVHAEYAIRAYFRFKDDISVFSGGEKQSRHQIVKDIPQKRLSISKKS